LVLILAVAFALFSISVSFLGRIDNFFQTYTKLPIAEFLLNLILLSSAGFLWTTYRRWRLARRREEELEDIISSISPDALIVIDHDRNVIMCNDSVNRVFGYEGDEVIGHKVDLLYCGTRPDPRYKHQLYDKLTRDGFDIGSATGKNKDGDTVPLEIITGTLAGGGGSVLLLRDITDRRRTEEEKEKVQSQLLQAQKMDAIGTLAGGVAHDFNNLLTTIQGYADLTMRSLNKADPLYMNLKQIGSSAVRASNLTRQLLLFSRRQPMELSLLNLNGAVEDLLKMLNRLIGEDIVTTISLEPVPWTVRADGGQIDQIMVNLAVNARDAMPEGGKLAIKTENVILDEQYRKVSSEARPGKFVCLSVEDTGVGIDKETMRHIFEPFFTTKQAGKGTGLGLSVVYGIVKQHEGWISVDSGMGQGSTFRVYLPVFSEEAEEKAEVAVSVEALQGHGEQILLVEDEKDVLGFAAKVLQENGYAVVEAATAQEALDVFEVEKGDFELVFADVVLPDKSGIQLVDQLLSQKPELRVLLSSGYTDDKSQWPVIKERGFRFLPKPYALPELLGNVAEALRDGESPTAIKEVAAPNPV
jgi:PAS domain S-box-containing protein